MAWWFTGSEGGVNFFNVLGSLCCEVGGANFEGSGGKGGGTGIDEC